MPPNNHLSWVEIRDFTPGLWDVEDFSLPIGAAAIITNAVPLAEGGLRAFYKSSSDITTSGLDNASQESVLAFFSRSGISCRGGTTTCNVSSSDRYLMTFNATDSKVRVYRMDLTNDATAWTKIKTSAGTVTLTPHKQPFVYYTDETNDYVLFNLPKTTNSADLGLYAVKYSDGTITRLCPNSFGPTVVHQARIVTSIDTAFDGTIAWTEPAGLTFPADNTLSPDPSRSSAFIRSMHATVPGDLLIGRTGAPWLSIQGDLEDPTVYTMDGVQPVGDWLFTPIDTPDGIVYATKNQTLRITRSGASGQEITPHTAFYSAPEFHGTFYDKWLLLYAGHVMDWDTKAVFDTDYIGNVIFAEVDGKAGKVVFATSGTSFSLHEVDMDRNTARASSMRWKSGPIRNTDDTRQIEIREVGVSVRVLQAASCVQMTVNSVTHAFTGLAIGRHNLRFMFRERGEQLDIDMTLQAPSTEAPILESLRVGWQAGHLI